MSSTIRRQAAVPPSWVHDLVGGGAPLTYPGHGYVTLADFVRGRVQRFMAGDAISVELWAMINLELWRREFLTGAIRMKAIAS